ncbi:hypothetical protein FIBSPDRAFT_897558 [Athelia psychrophila]|uniref:Uncharacterized protein n=1 Tax=Athelia psychrophila TaxID=1759441 RepID=A0A166C586_9AGAM|nr:hypothetical protein FIBSPDRAFT_897558 [Fibularhizoctonia sp. CBS 109695]
MLDRPYNRLGDSKVLSAQLPSYPRFSCQLVLLGHRQIQLILYTGASAFTSSTPVGVNPECDTLLAGSCITGEIAPALRMAFYAGLAVLARQGRPLLGSAPLVVLTGIHVGIVAALFWSLLNRIAADGGLVVSSLDTEMHFTHVFSPSSPLNELTSIPVFALTSATAIYLVHMAYIVLGALNEVRPMWFYVLSGVLFALSQLDYFLLNKLICRGMNAKIDGSFVASLCETPALGVAYLARRSITKGSWDGEYPVQETISRGVGNPAFAQNRSPAREDTE